MNLKIAEQQKTFNAEKNIAYVRAIVIIYGTFTYFFLNEAQIKKELSYFLIFIIWLYGLFVLYYKPYEKYSIFLASWFTYISDCVFAMLWIYATGGSHSPYHVMLYTSIIAVAFRFNLRTTLLTASLYCISYCTLLYFLGQFDENLPYTLVRMGFIFIIGFMTYLITKETLNQTQQKLDMQALAEQTKEAHKLLAESQVELASLNEELQLKNNIFSHAEENAHIGSYSWNLNNSKLEYSDNLFHLFGYSPGDFTPSFEKYLSFIHPDDRQKIIEESDLTLKNHKVTPAIHRIIDKHGELKYLRATGKFNAEGNDPIIIGTLQDITEDVLLQRELEIKNFEMEQVNHQLASFNYVASHDLQEPVRKIMTFSNLILQKEGDQLSDSTKGYIERIGISANRMQELINAFLNYSKIGSMEILFEETDLNKLIEEVKTDLHELISNSGAIIECEKLPIVPIVPIQFHQVFVNLLNNAIKYSKKDVPPKIQIFSEKISGKDLKEPGADADKNYWKISVKDNGIGFDTKYAGKIFEAFQRLHGKDKYEGSGIGLAICKKVLQMHNGFITVSSAPDEGSTFDMYIPSTNNK